MGQPAERRLLWILIGLALLSRLVWVLWVHPPGNYLYSDMRLYMERAVALADKGIPAPTRTLAWQAYGTHTLLAAPLRLFGTAPPMVAGALLWGLLGAAAVPLAYLLACRVLRERWQARTAGIAALLWFPNLSTTGFFLSETPFLFAQLLSLYWLVVCFQEGKRAWPAGVASAIAFMLRPQAAVFYVFVLLVWLVNVRRLQHIKWHHIVGVGAPLVLALGFSLWRFHYHTGYWGGIAENANMNLTAGRCHNINTQAYRTEFERAKAERKDDQTNGRRVTLPGFRTLKNWAPEWSPLALRPALGGDSIRFVGYIGDPFVHKDIRAKCYAATGLLEQVRYSFVNMMLQWFIAGQWPETSKGHARTLVVSEIYRYFFNTVVLLPSLVGIGLALRGVRRDPAMAVLAVCLVGAMIIAAIFFGDPRLRTPYDPVSIILALYAVAVALPAWRAWRARRSGRTPAQAV
ncbi:ArnT family glycosyltransferase [Nannocystis punicea]|uniref:Dolichyl-phosphate-mannose-protein mannosyltransferase n=1 Tax=Nannocystis punicea TaxID=2995304 RepID=A0ABY7H3A3_9BACT|nr:hypothetical protein [Nannocystis poenicansa]WAS93633.1 hypothetical protein O0S08_46470 [Nannocystis poenicansa]